MSYRELNAITGRFASFLRKHGVGTGDRVGILLPKSLASVVSIYAALKAGAAYVPLDSFSPPARLIRIIRDSSMETLLTCSPKAKTLEAVLSEDSPLKLVVLVDCDSSVTPAGPLTSVKVNIASWREVMTEPSTITGMGTTETNPAYILYTSGSTGMPKGVVMSHRNSLSFVDWATRFVGLTSTDRVSSHAPIHFDLSTFDIFASCKAGATVVLIPDRILPFPVELARFIERQRITVWYSVPSALVFMLVYGNMSKRDLSALRTVIFAGEVFPIKYLKQLMSILPKTRLLNWYGPTETNVCTCYEVTESDRHRVTPVPIGKPCANSEAFALDHMGRRIAKGKSGELLVRGPSVMQGYWGDKEKTAKVLVQNPLSKSPNQLVYKTGDIMTLDARGNYVYLGRLDAMIKMRGYRVETGEIETILYQHPHVREAVVIPIPDEMLGNRLRAVVSLSGSSDVTSEELQAFCAERLPRYMVPETIEFKEKLPRTSTGKVDRLGLQAIHDGKRV